MSGDSVLLAEVDRARGLKGEVVARFYADDPARLDEIDEVEIVPPDGVARKARLEGWKRRGDRVVLKLSGVDTVDQARGLAGSEIRIPRGHSAGRAPDGRFFAHQLEGMSVVNGASEVLGRVRRVLAPAGQTLLEVEGPRASFMVPLVGAICVKIDLERGEIVIDPPEGLIELNAV